MLKKHVNARSWRKEFFAVQAGILHRFRSKKHYVEHTAAAAAYGPHSKQVRAGVCVCVCVCGCVCVWLCVCAHFLFLCSHLPGAWVSQAVKSCPKFSLPLSSCTVRRTDGMPCAIDIHSQTLVSSRNQAGILRIAAEKDEAVAAAWLAALCSVPGVNEAKHTEVRASVDTTTYQRPVLTRTRALCVTVYAAPKLGPAPVVLLRDERCWRAAAVLGHWSRVNPRKAEPTLQHGGFHRCQSAAHDGSFRVHVGCVQAHRLAAGRRRQLRRRGWSRSDTVGGCDELWQPSGRPGAGVEGGYRAS